MTQITKQQIADKLRDAETVLITTDTAPSIGQLSAGLGLVGILEDMDKNVLFVYDGEISPTLEFLKADEIIAADAEPLRDFIISFETTKVDKFRYTQEEKQYNILLTPSRRQVINQEDISYHKGDFNIDLIVSLGVSSRSSICRAVGQHKQLMDEIAMVNILADGQESSLEAEAWQAAEGSSLGEMVYELSQALEDNYRFKDQIANALLTSIVEHTERFKNKHTQSATMHVAGELIECGADPVLVADSLAGYQPQVEVTADVEEIVASTDANAIKTKELKDVSKKQTKRSRRRYVTIGDTDAKLSIGKRSIEQSRKKEEEKHTIGQIKVSSTGDIQIVAEDKDEKKSVAETAQMQAIDAPADDSSVEAHNAKEAVTQEAVAGSSDLKNEADSQVAQPAPPAMAPPTNSGRVIQPLSDSPAASAPTPLAATPNNNVETPVLSPPTPQVAPPIIQPSINPTNPTSETQPISPLPAAAKTNALDTNQYVDALTNPLNTMPAAANPQPQNQPQPNQAMTVDNYLAQSAPVTPPPATAPLPTQALNPSINSAG